MLLHIGAFHLDEVHNKASQLSTENSLAAQTRWICTLLAVFAIALTPNGHWWTWCFYGLMLIPVIWHSRINLFVLLKRMVVESAFVGVILLSTLFREGGEVLWSWGWLQVTTNGLTILGSVTSKAMLSLLILNTLTLSTSIPLLLHGLMVLRTPPLLVAILASMYRYTSVLIAEFHAMRCAALSRNFSGNNLRRRQVIGNMIGMLFVRTCDRGERIHQAMLARGFQGIPPLVEVPQSGWKDGLAITMTFVITLLGQIIYLK